MHALLSFMYIFFHFWCVRSMNLYGLYLVWTTSFSTNLCLSRFVLFVSAQAQMLWISVNEARANKLAQINNIGYGLVLLVFWGFFWRCVTENIYFEGKKLSTIQQSEFAQQFQNVSLLPNFFFDKHWPKPFPW